jgi:hypothetical protein
VAKLASKSSTLTWVWLWDALVLLLQYYPRILAERMLVCAIAARKVRRKRFSPADETVVTVSTQGTASVISMSTASDLPIWRKLSGEGDDPHVLFPGIHWEESTIEAHWRGRHRVFRVKVALEDVQQLLPEDVLATLAERRPNTQEEPAVVRRMPAMQWIAREAWRLKRIDAMPDDISKTEFAKLLADNMERAATYDLSISITPITWKYIRNHLSEWALWPIPVIKTV